MRKKILFLFFIISLIGFFLNFIWENFHSVFYTNTSPWVHLLPYYLICTFGDIFAILFFYFIFSLIYKNWFWVKNFGYKDTVLLIFLGVVFAVVVEKIALISNSWEYTSAMPIVPIIEVGLSPITQMVILPVITFYLVKLIYLKFIKKIGII